ncbi:MAG: rhodanese-like domain-containing protein [Deltaproteobacteria bacterium]|nr:rhodanese-like domain-containing protein [Deltaproteobacteria bacterium]
MSLGSIFNKILSFGDDGSRIDEEELKAVMDSGEPFTLIDVRNPNEVSTGRIPKSIPIPLSMLENKNIPCKGKIILYCAGGVRSVKAKSILKSKGCSDVVDLKGGINAWVKAGNKIIR